MGKSLEELKKSFEEISEKIYEGEKRLASLFTEGVTVNHPLRNGEAITFKNNEDANNFLYNELRVATDKSGQPIEFPLVEMGRNDNSIAHMKLFLISKGVKPDEIVEFLMNPGSETSKKVENIIMKFRQDYFDQVIEKDTTKIAKMYVDACKNMKDYKLDWIRQANTPEKCLEYLPKFKFFEGFYSAFFQTLMLGTEMRKIDYEIVESILKQSKEIGLDYYNVADAIQYPGGSYQTMAQAFHAFEVPTNRAKVAIILQCNGTIPEGATFGTVGGGGDFSIYKRYRSCTTIPQLIGTEIEDTDLEASVDAFLQGQEGAEPPFQIFQNPDEQKQVDRLEWGLTDQDFNVPFEDEPKNWKRTMEKQFREGDLMDAISVSHCIKLAKNDVYDKISGKRGDGERMLQVMNGDYSQYDKLSDLSKAAVSGRLVMEHPELFMGSSEEMRKAAEGMGLDFENPVYAAAMDGAKKQVGKLQAESIAEMKASYAVNKLNAALQDVPIESKKSLAKALFMMQLGDKDAVYSENLRRKNATMLETLAQGGEIHFVLPKMTEQEKSDLKSSMPVGNTSLPNGVTQGVQYGSDNAMNVRVGGAIGRSVPQEGMEVDLRGMSAASLNACLRGLDEKISSMSDDEVDKMIGKLKGGSLEKSELAGMILGFGKDAVGQDKQDMALFSLAAKEANPPLVLDQNDFIAFDRVYSMELDGERKYNGPDILPIEQFEQALEADTKPGRKEYFTKFLEHYKEQVRQMEMYANAAERMHRVRIENEKSVEPLNNVRIFSQNKEKELSEKYYAAKQSVERMQNGIRDYTWDGHSERAAANAWTEHYFYNPDLAKEVNEKAGKTGVSKEDLERSMTSNFTAIDVEASTFREQDKLKDHTWSFLGVKFKNSGRYNDILNSMGKLEDLRKQEVNVKNIEEYKKEYALLRDFCEDYIVSHKNPWTKAGKERLQMVKDTWEGMSNVKAENFNRALGGAQEGKKLGELNVHSGDRRRVSLQELMARDSDRRKRLNTARAERRAAMRSQQDVMKRGGLSRTM